jgi:hypothetical protein
MATKKVPRSSGASNGAFSALAHNEFEPSSETRLKLADGTPQLRRAHRTCGIPLGEVEECRDMIDKLMVAVFDLANPDVCDESRKDMAWEAMGLLRYVAMQLDESLERSEAAAVVEEVEPQERQQTGVSEAAE